MTYYRPFELHCHTQHSDGQFTVPELCRAAKAYGFDGLALTDHNTSAGIRDWTPELQAQTIPMFTGIEWTTFFGHLLVLGCDHFVDWRFVTPDTIDDALLEIRQAGGTAGIAHPCEFGAPLMCGCHWDFHVTRWDLVDYIEIWSQDDPMSRCKNQMALPWWTDLLNQGHHLPISAGRDWHAADEQPKMISATYLGLQGDKVTEAEVMNALRAGRTYLTLGPTMHISLTQGEKSYGLGETAKAGEACIRVTVGLKERYEVWARYRIMPSTIRIVANGQTLCEMPYCNATASSVQSLPKGWMRIELYGIIGERQEELLAISSPIYLENP